jgi:hypothetical protein
VFSATLGVQLRVRFSALNALDVTIFVGADAALVQQQFVIMPAVVSYPS